MKKSEVHIYDVYLPDSPRVHSQTTTDLTRAMQWYAMHLDRGLRPALRKDGKPVDVEFSDAMAEQYRCLK